ncbi:MAG: DNA replication and repair protein RecF [Candidatus Heimdallarchaeota archaeon LC_3]|nr:MAG: DNA replication and repair protein RecF [Candidatus Heimdallarchaeota archaeon LC_3]
MDRIKLNRFRIQNYRSIEDSGWVDIKDVTSLVGKNESGKTSLLVALYKLNSATKTNYDHLTDFPRSRLAEDYKKKDWIVASGEFQIPKEEISDWKKPEKFEIPDHGIKLILSRHYSGKRNYKFEPEIEEINFINVSHEQVKLIRTTISKKKSELISRTDNNDHETQENIKEIFTKEKKQSILDIIDKHLQIEVTDMVVVRRLCDELNEFLNEVPEIENIIEYIENLIEDSKKPKYASTLWKMVKEKLPVLIYFENYGILKGAFHIPTFVNRIKLEPNHPEIRTQLTLFKHVNLELDEIYEMGRMYSDLDASTIEKIQEDPSEVGRILESVYTEAELRASKERKIYLESASKIMTEKFSSWWVQRRHVFKYDIDGVFFDIKVSDDVNPAEIPLEGRSKGLQWFFSFYLIFLVESEDMYKDAILLLDEPGLHLHATAQLKLLDFFEKLSESNQIIYATHSPFIIDGNHLNRVRTIMEGTGGKTTVIDQVGTPLDKDTVFPLQAALGYSIMQTLFFGKKQLILEGISDYNYIKSINVILQRAKKKSLNKDIVLIPTGGTSKLSYMASLLIAQESTPIILLDADKIGISTKNKLARNLLSRHPETLLLIDEFISIKESEIEDFIGNDVLQPLLSNIITSVPDITFLEKGTFCKQVIKWCQQKKIELSEDWKVLLSYELMDNLNDLTFDDNHINRYSDLIMKVNNLSQRLQN